MTQISRSKVSGKFSVSAYLIIVITYALSFSFLPLAERVNHLAQSNFGNRLFDTALFCWFSMTASGWAMLMIVPMMSILPLPLRVLLGFGLPFLGWVAWCAGSPFLKLGPGWNDLVALSILYFAGLIGAASAVTIVRFSSNYALTRREISPTNESHRMSIAEIMMLTASLSLLLGIIRLVLTSWSIERTADIFGYLLSAIAGIAVMIPALCGTKIACGKLTRATVVVTIMFAGITMVLLWAVTFFLFANGSPSISRLQDSGVFWFWIATGPSCAAASFGSAIAFGLMLRREGYRLRVASTAGEAEGGSPLD